MAHVPHLLVRGPWNGAVVPLDDSHTHHLTRVLRLADGEPVSYTDGAGAVGTGKLVAGGIQRGAEEVVDPPTEVTVAVAAPASRSRARFLVEKLAELGARQLWWVDTAHSEGRAPRREKAEAWAVSALEQSRGAWLMEVGSTTLDALGPGVVVADRSGIDPWPDGPVVILIGPEGGLAPDEIPGDARRVSLGSTVLRVETAAIVATAVAAHRGG